jgi:tripartite-type tricarboxylate transporter receptor subunit TctC
MSDDPGGAEQRRVVSATRGCYHSLLKPNQPKETKMKQSRHPLAVLALVLAGGALAQSDYPSKPIRMVVPYTPGGPADTVARLIAARIAERLKQPVLVENRPGAGALIGGEAVVRSAPDGYTILSVGGAVYSRVFVKNPPFELMRDLAPISRTYGGGLMVLVSGQVPARTTRELIDYAKANPGKLNYGFGASNAMLAMEALKRIGSFDATGVAYKGAAPVAIALVAGDIQVTVDAPLPYIPHIQSGKVRALAIGTDQRMAILPEVPTATEAGYPAFKAEFNGGLWAPAGTPRDIIDKLNAAVVEAVKSPEVLEPVRKAGLFAASSTPEGFRQVVQGEIDFWAQAAKIANYQPE